MASKYILDDAKYAALARRAAAEDRVFIKGD